MANKTVPCRCGQILQVRPDQVGRRIGCPACGADFTVMEPTPAVDRNTGLVVAPEEPRPNSRRIITSDSEVSLEGGDRQRNVSARPNHTPPARGKSGRCRSRAGRHASGAGEFGGVTRRCRGPAATSVGGAAILALHRIVPGGDTISGRALVRPQPFDRSARFLSAIEATLRSSLRRRFRLVTAVVHDVLRVSFDPGVRQERLEIDVVGRERDQQRTHISKRFDQVPLRAGQNAQTGRRRFAAAVTAEKQPVLASDGRDAKRSLGNVVVDPQPAILHVSTQRFPLIPGITDRFPVLTLGATLRDLARPGNS